jgi:hypothetical protein
MSNEVNQIHNFISSYGFGTVISYGSGSGSDVLTSYGSGSASTVPVPFPVPQHCCTAHWSSFDFRKTYVFRNSSVARLNLCKDKDTVGHPLTGRGLNLRVSYVGGKRQKTKQFD